MAIDGDGNFYNPYLPGTYEYDYEESQRLQPGVELTPEEQAKEIAYYQQYIKFLAANPGYVANAQAIAQRYIQESGGSDKWMSGVFPTLLAVAPFLIPGIGTAIGSAILGTSAASLGTVVGLTAAELSAAVGSAALSAAGAAVQGGSPEQILRSAASAGIATGLNLGVGGGIGGAVIGSTAGTIVGGGNAEQILLNAVAAGAGSAIAGIYGQTAGTAVRNLIQTGSIEQALLAGALSEIGQRIDTGQGSIGQTIQNITSSSSKPVGQPFTYGDSVYQELEDGSAKVDYTNTKGETKTRYVSAEDFKNVKADYADEIKAGTIKPPGSSTSPGSEPINFTSGSTSPAVGQPFQYAGNTYQELADGTARVVRNSDGKTLVMSSDMFSEIKEDYARDTAPSNTPINSTSPANTAGSTSTPAASTTTSSSPPVGQPFVYAGSTYQELADGTARVISGTGAAKDYIISKETLSELKQDYARDLASGSVQLPIVNVNQPGSSTNTSLDTQVLNLLNKANTAPVVATVPTPAPTPAAVPKIKTEASVARQFLKSMGIVTVGMSADELAKQLKNLSPTNDYEITNFTEELEPVKVVQPAPAPVSLPTVPMPADTARIVLKSRGINTVGMTSKQLSDKLHEIEPSQYFDITGFTEELAPVAVNETKPTDGKPPVIDPVIIQKTTQAPILTTIPTVSLNPVVIQKTTQAPILTTVPTISLKPVVIQQTTQIPTLPFWWQLLTSQPTLEIKTIVATTGAPTLETKTITETSRLPVLTTVPTLERKVVVETTSLPVFTTAPTLERKVIVETTSLPVLTTAPTLEKKVITETTSLPVFTTAPTLERKVIVETTSLPVLTTIPTLERKVISETTTLPTLTLAPTTKATTLGPTTPAPTTPAPTKKVIYPVVTNVPPTRRPVLPIITGARPARLLADALAAYRPPGAIEGDESGKERQNVWNEKSLRLKDALGL